MESKEVAFVAFVGLVEQIIRKYVDTNEDNYKILTFWVVGTYLHSQFNTYPLLQLNAQKRSGKSRTLRLCSFLSKGSDGSVHTSVTETMLYRHEGGAMFLDEMESLNSKDKTALRETLNAVYKKGNKVIRYVEKKDKDGTKRYVEEPHYPFYPVGLASIAGMGDVLADRAINLVLQRSKQAKTCLIEDYDTNPEILKVKSGLTSISINIPEKMFSEWNSYVQGGKVNNETLKNIFDQIKGAEIIGRPLELFMPLFVIAHFCGELTPFLVIAKNYVSQREEEESADDVDEILKSFLQSKKAEYSDYVNVSKIVTEFRGVLENPEEWVNVKWMGRALKRLDFIANKRRVSGCAQIRLKLPETLQTLQTLQTLHTQQTTTTQQTQQTLLPSKEKITIDEDELP